MGRYGVGRRQACRCVKPHRRPYEIQLAVATAGANRSRDGDSITDTARSNCSAACRISPMGTG